MSKNVDIKLPKLILPSCQLVEISTSKDRSIQNDEYDTDTDDIVSDIEKVNQTKIRILLAGASKSHICQKMVDNGYSTQYYLYGLLIGYHINLKLAPEH